jgi:hypothetical protein
VCKATIATYPIRFMLYKYFEFKVVMATQNSNCKGHGINEEILGTCFITHWEHMEHVGNPLKT